MSWYHTDWSWTQMVSTAAVALVLLGTLVWAAVELVQANRRARRGHPAGRTPTPMVHDRTRTA